VHIVFFADQHLESLGGAQVSMRLQKRYLERAGHVVSVVAPALRGARAAALASRIPDPAYIDTPSIAITPDREYSLTLPGRRTDRLVDEALRRRPPVDLVHVQADFWGALTGHRFAARHRLPLVQTMHNRVGVGIAATLAFPSLALRLLGGWQHWMLGRRPPAGDAWGYLAGLARRADAVTAPSAHFARRLEEHGAYAPSHPHVDVIWNGIDDEMLDEALALRVPRRPGPPRLIWLGRMSPEKRLLPFLEALCESGLRADVQVLGGGAQRRAAERFIERRAPEASVVFGGRMTYAETLRRIAEADAVVQTSIGFETQGMTVFEGASLGTPAIISDPDIAAELGSGFWQVPDSSTSSLARTLVRAAADVAAGTAPVPDPGVADRFRQSSRTQAMLAVYERVLA